MTKILMVCLGNICRSPMAEGIMRTRMDEYGIDGSVDSCGTSSWHVGERPDHRAIQKMQSYNIDIKGLRGRQFTTSDFNAFDHIYVMDQSNYRDVLSLAESEEDKSKVQLLLNVSYPNENMSVPDPYYGVDDGFEDVYRLINDACTKICETLSAK